MTSGTVGPSNRNRYGVGFAAGSVAFGSEAAEAMGDSSREAVSLVVGVVAGRVAEGVVAGGVCGFAEGVRPHPVHVVVVAVSSSVKTHARCVSVDNFAVRNMKSCAAIRGDNPHEVNDSWRIRHR